MASHCSSTMGSLNSVLDFKDKLADSFYCRMKAAITGPGKGRPMKLVKYPLSNRL